MSYFVHLDILPVTPSLLPSNQNSSMTLSTSMTSPVKRGNSSETLGRNSNTVRTTDPASITHYLQSKADKHISPAQTLARVYRFKSVSAQSTGTFLTFSVIQKTWWEHRKATSKGNGKWSKKKNEGSMSKENSTSTLPPFSLFSAFTGENSSYLFSCGLCAPKYRYNVKEWNTCILVLTTTKK